MKEAGPKLIRERPETKEEASKRKDDRKGNVASGGIGRQRGMWRQGTWRQGNAASGNAASWHLRMWRHNVASQCGVTMSSASGTKVLQYTICGTLKYGTIHPNRPLHDFSVRTPPTVFAFHLPSTGIASRRGRRASQEMRWRRARRSSSPWARDTTAMDESGWGSWGV